MNQEYMKRAKEDIAQRASDKRARAKLLENAKRDGIGIVHIYDSEYPKGGLTIAFAKTTEYKTGCMVTVAVNTCSQEDAFNKKIGILGALEKFYNVEVIQLPLLRTYATEDLNFAVKNAFMALYFLA